MKRLLALILAVQVLGAVPVSATPAAPSGTIAGPFGDASLGGIVTFDTTSAGLKGWQYPMVDLTCYQDVDNDGTIEFGYPWDDIVYSWLDRPDADFWLGAYDSLWYHPADGSVGGGDAECRAEFVALGWKGGVQQAAVLAAVTFHAAG